MNIPNERLVLGISATEKAEAQVWAFQGRKLIGKVAEFKTRHEDPRALKDDYLRTSFPISIIGGFLDAIVETDHEIAGIGISTPGNVDRIGHRIRNVSRYNYAPHEAYGVLVDTTPIDIKEQCRIKKPLTTNNDVTCISVASRLLDCGNEFSSFVYLYIDKGVNIGVISDGKPLLGAMHPELGHYGARLEGLPKGWTLDEDNSFCGFRHHGCFESLISREPLDRRCDLPAVLNASNSDEFKFLVSCISQLCEISTLAFAPEKIIIGSDFVTPDVLGSVRTQFRDNMKRYPLYDERQKVDFIDTSGYSPDDIASLGAAILANDDLLKTAA